MIANNQVGFTTDPTEGRSTRYSSDLAKGFDVPIVHVNADDPEAALCAVRLALAYRARVRPRLRDRPRRLPALRAQRAGRGRLHAAADGGADRAAADRPRAVRRAARRGGRASPQEEADAIVAEVTWRASGRARAAARRRSRQLAARAAGEPPTSRSRATPGEAVVTAVPARAAARAQRAAARRARRASPCNPKLARAARAPARGDRRGRHRLGPGGGARLRLAARGRHPDPPHRPGHRARHVLAPPPRAPRPGARARRTRRSSTCRARTPRSRSTTRRSPSTRRSASSTATRSPRPTRSCSGRRSSATSSTARRSSIDQFIVAGRSKWGQTSRLTLLLPHGYEGNGPEHSSARLERFLQLGAQENIRIANCTTAAQYFHLLRRQALDATARPLVVMTPEGAAPPASRRRPRWTELADGRVPAGDRRPGRRPRRRCGGSCSARGKVYYDIVGHEARAERRQTSPSPGSSSSIRSRSRPSPALIASYPRLERDRLGAGGAAEHGRLALDPAPARGRRRARARGAGRHVRRAGRGARARARAIRPRTSASRTASSARRSASGASSARRCGLGACAAAAASPRRRPCGPCVRAASSSSRRCAGGSRRHIRQSRKRDADGVRGISAASRIIVAQAR